MALRNLSMWASLFATAFCAASAQAVADFPPQRMLDAIAKPLPSSGRMAMPAEFPIHFLNWTEVQKQSGLQLVVQRCGLMFALEHDNPAARMVPQAMTRQQEAQLAMSVCVPAKMPEDWSDRHKYLETAQQLIDMANANGGSLSLPINLKGN